MDSYLYPIVENVVASVEPYHPVSVNLQLIGERISGARYNKRKVREATIRRTKPKGTVILYESGRMAIFGSQSEFYAQTVARKLVRDINKKLNMQIKIKKVEITNIVAQANLGYKINTQRLVDDKYAKYAKKDEQFPGVIYQMNKEIQMVRLFQCGKMVFTGTKKRKHIYQQFDRLLVFMEKYRITEQG